MDPIRWGDAALNHSQKRDRGSLSRNERNAAFGFMKGHGFQDATFESALDATFQALHAARLKDLIRSLNAKSALTTGDLCPLRFRNGNTRVSSLLGFDVRAGIKADGSDYCVINYRPYGLPINRPHPP